MESPPNSHPLSKTKPLTLLIITKHSKMKTKIVLFSIAFSLLGFSATFAQYNKCAGMNSVDEIVKVRHRAKAKSVEMEESHSESAPEMDYEKMNYRDIMEKDGDVDFSSYDIESENTRIEQQTGQHIAQEDYQVASNQHGNASGSEFDLAVDGAFLGQKIVVVQLYPFSFGDATKALNSKGFSIERFTETPSPTQLANALDDACQLWVISDCSQQHFDSEHLAVIQNFFDKGKGLYIWGDNDPCYPDANYLAKNILGVEMHGDLPGTKTVGLQQGETKAGLVQGHLITTGLEYVYEGITIATIDENEQLDPILYGSENNLVAAVYDKNQKRAILDTGFTRLYNNWQDAGTARYVKNAAAWLTNAERFGDEVVAKGK